MATGRKSKRASRGRAKRRASTSRSRTLGWLPEGSFNPDAPISIWRGISKSEIAAEQKARVVLTEHSVRQAVRQLVRLAAIWESTADFTGMLPELQQYNRRVLEDVVALLNQHDREAPIATVAGYRITRADEELVILHAAVAAVLEQYVHDGDAQRALASLAWKLGNSCRVTREDIDRAWNHLRAGTGSTNWVTFHGGGSEAAKMLLGELVPGASSGRLSELKRLAKGVSNGRNFSSDVRAVFEKLENHAWATQRYPSDAVRYAAMVLG